MAVLSAIFSVDRTSSLFGFYGRFSDGLIGLLSLGVFYFLLANNTHMDTADNAEKGRLSVSGILKAFTWSVFFVVLLSYFSIFGVWARLDTAAPGMIPSVMLQKAFNPVSGSMEGLTIFLAVTTVLFVGLLLNLKSQVPNPRFQNVFHWLLILASLAILIIVDYSLAWVVLLISLSVFLVFALITRIFKDNINRLLLPIFLILVAAVFLFFDVTTVVIPQEPVLGQEISWQTSFGAAIAETPFHLPPHLASQVSVTEKIKSGFLGSGIGTYFYDFAKFKPVEFNQSSFWQRGFNRSGSHFAEVLGTMGFLGLISYLALIGVFLLISWFLLKTKASSFQLALLTTFLALVVGQLIYHQNSSLALAFWLVLGVGAISWQRSAGGPVKEKIVSFKEMPELSLVFSSLLIIFVATLLGLYYFGVSYYLADVNFYKGLTFLGQERLEKLERAVELNPRFARYRLVFSQGLLFEFFQELRKPLAEQDAVKMQTTLVRSINEARTATNLQPNFVDNWTNLGVIYRGIVGLAEGNLAERSIESFERALVLEPTNPVTYTELGRLYLTLGDEQKAREYFQKAQEKKPDYADAIIQEALLLEEEAILEEAIAKLEDLILKDPWNVEVHFQLGRLYYNAGRIDEATGLFEAVVYWVPEHSNALYSLGLAYAAKARIQEAILVFERVLGLNPGNQDVIQKLEELKKPKEEEKPEEPVGQPGEQEEED